MRVPEKDPVRGAHFRAAKILSASTIKRRISATLLIVAGILFIFPLIVTFTNSFMSETEIAVNYTTKISIVDLARGITENFVQMRLIPARVTLGQYITALLYQPSFLVLLMNSIKITVPVVIGNTIVSLLAAYGFTIWKNKYKEAVFFIYVLVMLMPLQAVIVPNYIIADMLSIKDSYFAIILPGIFAPFGTFLLRQSMKAIPISYIEAAEIDGANKFYTFIHVVVPQMKAGIAALAMLVFIEYWNIVEQAVIFINEYYREPLSVYLSRIASGNVSLISAASCVYMFLPLWFLVLGQKDLEMGIELSGVK